MLKLRSILLAALWLAAFPVLATAATVDVSVVDNRFSPNDITINVGDTVRWTNAIGGASHDVTSDDGKFSPSVTATSFTFSRTFNSVDEILYHCTVHSSPGRNRNSNMNGRVNVVDSAQVAPTADFTSNCTDLVCSFTDQSSDSDGTIVSWSWNFGDGGMSSMQNPGHTYAAAGTFSVGLTVTDNDGESDTINKNVAVSMATNQAPNAAFSSSCTDLDCNFTDLSTDSDGSIASWSWNFGDGGMSSMQNPGHTYAAAGTFSVGLTVTDNDGESDTINKNVAVSMATNQAPNAAFSSSCTDLDCNFTDLSTDSDGTIASRSWDFGDGGASSLRNPAHSYAAAGTFTVKLTVTDNDGAADSQSSNVTVTAPSAEPFLINAAMSDAWFFPDTSGQGFFIIIWEEQKLVFLAWFTYDTERPPEDVSAIFGEPGHRWVTALGPFEGDTALLDVFLSSGMILDSAEPPVDTVQMEGATIEIVWSGCNKGVLKYDIPSLGLSGEIPIERIVLDNVPACEAAQP